MIPVDYQPPKIEIVHEMVIELPKKENLRIYPVKFFEHETVRGVIVTVEDTKQDVWIYNITMYFDNKDDFIADLKVPRQLFSFSPRFNWHQQYLEALVEILLQTKWEELVDAYNEEQAAILQMLIDVSKQRNTA